MSRPEDAAVGRVVQLQALPSSHRQLFSDEPETNALSSAAPKYTWVFVPFSSPRTERDCSAVSKLASRGEVTLLSAASPAAASRAVVQFVPFRLMS